MVDGHVVASSYYKIKSMLKTAQGSPTEVKKFAEGIHNLWHPDNIYVMDVVETGGGFYKVIEYNCMNASGIYKANIEDIIVSVSDYVEKSILF